MLYLNRDDAKVLAVWRVQKACCAGGKKETVQ